MEVKVWGELACFTRPEMKAERVSYPVMTPSAARGVLEAIFWKPEFTWVVREIQVLRAVRYTSFLRNELGVRQVTATARGWAQTGVGGAFIDDDHTPRHTLALRDVAYLIRADMRLRSDVRDDIAKYRDQFRRRVARGQCYSQPYFGCREFAASFGPPDGSERPVALTEALGAMLLDIDFAVGGNGRGQPRFFDADAVLTDGVLRPPDPAELRRSA
jgi:CRISPR-associated protein Cas5d